jgi:hypothetical protein
MPETTAVPVKTFKNPMRISIAEYRAQEGYEDEDAWIIYLGDLVIDSVCPAMCKDGCEVEPDGRCEHGCPSLLLAMGMIQ